MPTSVAEAPHLQPPARNAWIKGLGLGLAIFVSGVVLGGSMARSYYLGQERERFFRPKNMPDDLVDSLTFDLGLSPEQHGQVLSVFKLHHGQMEALRAKIQPAVDAEMDGVRGEVAKVLNAEQLRRWDMRFEQMRARYRSSSAPPAAPAGATQVEVETPEKVAP